MSKGMTDLVKRLRIKAGMIEMGEMIAWGSDSALMREAADALEMAAPSVQGDPVGEAGSLTGTSGFTTAVFESRKVPVGTKLYATPQPEEQQPATDVAGLVEALEGIMRVEARDRVMPVGAEWDAARDALAAYHNQEPSHDSQ